MTSNLLVSLPSESQGMKRGFLAKAADKNKGLSDKQLQPSKPKDGNNPLSLQEIRSTLELPAATEDVPSVYRLPYGDLSEQEKALPDDYDKNDAILVASKTICKTIPHTDDGDGSSQWIIKDEYAEKKVLNTPGYPARIPKPRRPDLYEVRTTKKMGQGVFAKHDIKRGEIVFSERPLLVAPNWMDKARMTQYTFEQSQQIMMFEREKILEVAFQRMNENDKADFMALCNSHTNDGTGPLMGITRTNAFGANNLSEGDSVFHYSATCKLGSRLNHSCRPNVVFSLNIPSFSYQFVAARDIKAGEELFCTYINLARTKAQRQTSLAPYGFSCNCSACVNATPTTDELRKTYEDQVKTFEAMRNQPALFANLVASAKVLETKMLAEGLDCTFDFFSILLIIYLTYTKLGRMAEIWKYQRLIKEYAQIHVHSQPTLQQFIDM